MNTDRNEAPDPHFLAWALALGDAPPGLSGSGSGVAGPDAVVCLTDLDTGETFRFRLVPGPVRSRNGQRDRVFLETSLGAALAGRAGGSLVHWMAPSGMRRFMITSVK